MQDQCDDRLSWGDTVFLNLEREGMPLNVASLSILEGDIPFEQYLRFVESRLPRIPRFLRRIVVPPVNIGLPRWDYDPHFDICNHVREARLRHGSNAELKTFTNKILGKMLDRGRPLWELILVRGLKRNRTALIARMHHCLADGIAGVGIMTALMDPTPEIPDLRRKTRLRVPPPRNAVNSLVDGLASSCSNFAEHLLSAWSDVLNITERTLAHAGNGAADDFSKFLPEVTAPTQRLRFNVLYRGPQKFAYTEIPLAEVKAIRRMCDASVNDVLLALVTASVQRYCTFHGDAIKGRMLRLMVPVNLRGNHSERGLGNHISLVPVTLPLDIRDPKKLLRAVHERTEFLKRTHAAEVISLAAGLISIVPSALQSFAGPMISRVPFTPFNMVCTNVPGPQFPLYVLGRKMLRWYPYVPIGGELALNCAILSYDGLVHFGFSGDAHAAPDLSRVQKFLKISFDELKAAARIYPSAPKRPKTTDVPRRPPKPTETLQSHKIVTSAPLAPPHSLSPAHTLTKPTSILPVQPAIQTALKPESVIEEKKVLTQLFA
jgi:diacylglycerol O-acyltransferase / wax synthase